MDAVTLATAAVAALTPYLKKAGEAVAGELGKQALAKGEAILKALWLRWSGKPDAEKRLANLVANPDSGHEVLVATLAVDIAGDAAFASALTELLNDGSPEIFVRQAVGRGAEATGADIREMLSGRALIEQIIGENAKATGFKADIVGKR